MENIDRWPSRIERTLVARVLAITRGINERPRNSKSNNSIARITPAIGVLNVAAIPAPAPQASSTLRSAAVVDTNCPTSDPNAPPVWMIGPSAPKGPPVPIAMAAESGFRIATFASMRLREVSTASIASGMPCPLILSEPYFAMSPTIRPPITGITITQGPDACVSSGCENETTKCGSRRDW